MRLASFVVFFFLCIATLFGTFLWYNRVEFIQRSLERAIPPYHVELKRVEVPNTKTVVLYDLKVFSEDNLLVVEVPQLTLASNRRNWLFWLLTPSTAPLRLEYMAMTLSLCPTSMSFTCPHVFLPVEISNTICYTGKTTKVVSHTVGSFQDVITNIFLSSQSSLSS